MSYHAGVWLTVGAAAPVIALAAVVSKSEAAGLRNRFFTSPFSSPADTGDADVIVYRAARWLNWLITANLLLQATALAIALLSLAVERDQVPLVAPVIVEPLGLLLLAMTGSFAITLRSAPDRYAKLRDARAQFLLRKARHEAMPGGDERQHPEGPNEK